jgi:hypothetical protein
LVTNSQASTALSVEQAQALVAQTPHSAALRFSLAEALRGAGRRDEAVEAFRMAALMFGAAGRSEDAMVAASAGLALAPEHAELRRLVVWRNPQDDQTPLPVAVPFHDEHQLGPSIGISNAARRIANRMEADFDDRVTSQVPKIDAADLEVDELDDTGSPGDRTVPRDIFTPPKD